ICWKPRPACVEKERFHISADEISRGDGHTIDDDVKMFLILGYALMDLEGPRGCPAVKRHCLASNHLTGVSDSSITRYAGESSGFISPINGGTFTGPSCRLVCDRHDLPLLPIQAWQQLLHGFPGHLLITSDAYLP